MILTLNKAFNNFTGEMYDFGGLQENAILPKDGITDDGKRLLISAKTKPELAKYVESLHKNICYASIATKRTIIDEYLTE